MQPPLRPLDRFARWLPSFWRASGSYLESETGERFLDLAGLAGGFGHNHPRLVERAIAVLERGEAAASFGWAGSAASELSEKLCLEVGAPLSRVVYAPSGSAAIDGALRLCRAATGRAPVLYAHGGIHGRSVAGLSLASEPEVRVGLEPLLPGCLAVPFSDAAAVEQAIERHRPAALLLEPFQLEAGVRAPPPGYFRRVAEACKREGTLLVIDELQTGFGRAGQPFLFRVEGIAPDVLVTGALLSGGLLPFGVVLTTAEVHDRAVAALPRHLPLTPPGCPSALACEVALAALSVVREERAELKAEELGAFLLGHLRDRLSGHPWVVSVRGKGLFLSVELSPLVAGGARVPLAPHLSRRLLRRKVVAAPAILRPDVLTLRPPLTITRAEALRAVADLEALLEEVRVVSPDADEARAAWEEA